MALHATSLKVVSLCIRKLWYGTYLVFYCGFATLTWPSDRKISPQFTSDTNNLHLNFLSF